MNKVNSIVFSRNDFRDYDSFYSAIGVQVKTLLETNNLFVVYTVDNGSAVIIEFEPDVESLPKPFWLYRDEYDVAKEYHDEAELENCAFKLKKAKALNGNGGENDGGCDA